MWWTMIGKWVAIGYLVPAVIWDIRKKVVPVRLIRLALGIGLILRFLDTDGWGRLSRLTDVGQLGSLLLGLLVAMLPGLFVLGLGFVTGEAIGYADGWSVLLLGLFAGSRAAICIFMTALLFSALYALCLVVAKRVKPGMRFAFLPHISAGYIVWMMFQGMV